MTVSRDLFLSILSMDSYKSGHDQGIADLGDIGAGICNVAIFQWGCIFISIWST